MIDPRAESGTASPAAGVLPFEFFTRFRRLDEHNPILALRPPEWAAAAHAIVVDRTVHYLWARNAGKQRWDIMHSTAPVDRPWAVSHDPRNPVVSPSDKGFDDRAVEYPFPFRNPHDGRFYMYYRGKGGETAEQTGLLVSDGDLGRWTRVTATPVIPADTEHERFGSTHPSVAVVGDTIHIVYTGRAARSCETGSTMCHATAPVSDPARVTKDPANPVFAGTGQAWDSRAIRETELFVDAEHVHVLYGGFDGHAWRIGHVRTRDFAAFEPNPHNPVFVPSQDGDAFDCDGVLTPQVLAIGDRSCMLYAGRCGREWQTGLAVADEKGEPPRARTHRRPGADPAAAE